MKTRAANDPSVFTITEKASTWALSTRRRIVGAFSVIVKTDGSFAALLKTHYKSI